MTTVPHPGRRPVTDLATLEQSTAWVRSTPFRAHLRRLVAETGEHPRVLALAAGVAPNSVLALLSGRASGRRRIRARDASLLLALDRAGIAELAVTPVPAHTTVRRLEALAPLAQSRSALAAMLRLDTDGLDRLHRAEWTSALIELRAAAACGAAGLCGWWSGDAWFDDSETLDGACAAPMRDWAA